MFLENFFGTCGGYPVEVNYLNYVRDLKLYSPTNRHIKKNMSELVKAFWEITETTASALEDRIKQSYEDKEIPYWEDVKDLHLQSLYGVSRQPKPFLYELKIVRKKRRDYGALTKLRGSQEVYQAFRDRYDKADREEFLVLLLDNKNSMVGFNLVAVGSLTAAIVHPREVYKPAILANAAAVIFLHNHPSGDPSPSPEDIEITKRLKETGDILGFRVLDHVVIGDGRYFSFSDRGLL